MKAVPTPCIIFVDVFPLVDGPLALLFFLALRAACGWYDRKS